MDILTPHEWKALAAVCVSVLLTLLSVALSGGGRE